ncbi:hypothetical protein Tco_0273484 [Tanacetum coccineum]
MTYLITSLTLDSARSYMMQGASFTQGTISSIPIGGSISPEGFLPSIMLLVVVIITVVIVIVILIVVVVDDVSLILKLSFVIIVTFPSILLGIPVGPVFLLGLLALVIVTACVSRAAAMPSVITSRGYGMIHNDEDGDNDAYDDDGGDDEREINNIVKEEDEGWIYFLGGNNSSGTKKYRGSNSSDGGNTGDGVKIANGVIGSSGRIGIYDRIISFLESAKELKEVLPDVVEKAEV